MWKYWIENMLKIYGVICNFSPFYIKQFFFFFFGEFYKTILILQHESIVNSHN